MNRKETFEKTPSLPERQAPVVRRNQLARRMARENSLSSQDVNPNNLTDPEKELIRDVLEADGAIEVIIEDDPTGGELLSMERESPPTPKKIETVTIPSDLLITKKLIKEVYGKRPMRNSMGGLKNINPSPSSTPEEDGSEDEDTDASKDDSFDGESFADDMEGLAEDMEDQALRERRETFQAEITNVGWEDKDRRKDRRIKLVLDIPTHGEEVKFLQTPKSDQWNTLPCFTDVLEHLNVNLRQADQIEGMSIPVSYDEKRPNNWEIALGEKESEGGEEGVIATRVYFLKRLSKSLGKATESAWSWFVSSFSWDKFAAISIITIGVALSLGVMGLMGLYTPNKLVTLGLVAFCLEVAAALSALCFPKEK